MRRTLLSSVWLLLAIIARAAVPGSVQHVVHFETNSWTISAGEYQALEEVGHRLPSFFKFYRVQLSAYTDTDGESEHNDRLALLRSNEIKAVLQKMGFPSSRFSVEVYGERAQRMLGDDEATKAQNRVVVIEFWLDHTEKVDKLFPEKKNQEKMVFDATAAQTITAKDGTTLHIPASAFADHTGAIVQGKVEFVYTWYRKPEDFAFSDIELRHPMGGETTFFESSGMFELSAMQDGKSVVLAPEKQILVDFKQEETIENPAFYRYNSIDRSWSHLHDLPKKKDPKSYDPSTKAPRKVTEYGYTPANEGKDVASRKKINLDRLNWNKPQAYPRILDYISEIRKQNIDVERVRLYSHVAVKRKVTLEEAQILVDQDIWQRELRSIRREAKRYSPKPTIQFSKQLNGRLAISWKVRAMYGCNETLPLRALNIETEEMKITRFAKKHPQLSDIRFVRNDSLYTLTLVDGDDSITVPVTVQLTLQQPELEHLSYKKYTDQRAIRLKQLEDRQARKENAEWKLDSLNTAMAEYQNNPAAPRTKVPTVRTKPGLKAIPEIEAVFLATQHLFNQEITNSKDWEAAIKSMSSDDLNLLIFRSAGYCKQQDLSNVACENLCPVYSTPMPKPAAAAIDDKNVLENPEKIEALNSMTNAMICTELAIFNCDQVSRIEDPVYVRATYEDELGNEIQPLVIRVLMSNFNGVLQYDGYMNLGPKHFAASGSSEHLILATDEFGMVYMSNNILFPVEESKRSSVARKIQLTTLDTENARSIVAGAMASMNSKSKASRYSQGMR